LVRINAESEDRLVRDIADVLVDHGQEGEGADRGERALLLVAPRTDHQRSSPISFSVCSSQNRMSRGFQAFTRSVSLAIQSTDSRAAAAPTGS
jgi:hypothetical protein